MSLLEDLDDLMLLVHVKYDWKFDDSNWPTFYNWCNEQFGTNGWWLEKGVMQLRRPEYASIFVLRWT